MSAVVFHPPRPATLAAVSLAARATPAADPEGLTVRRIGGVRRVPWAAISSLRLRDQATVRAVLTDGAELPLPSVRIRDLPRLAAASGGHLTLDDPLPATDGD